MPSMEAKSCGSVSRIPSLITDLIHSLQPVEIQRQNAKNAFRKIQDEYTTLSGMREGAQGKGGQWQWFTRLHKG